MLVLTRRTGERLVITLGDGRRVVVEVLSITDGRVRLGLAGPTGVSMDREEVHERKQRDAAAARGDTP